MIKGMKHTNELNAPDYLKMNDSISDFSMTQTLLSSFLASTSKFATLLSFISSALICNREEGK